MLTLFLLRHAKAVQDPRRDDFDRELQPTGQLDAARLGRALESRGLRPDLALVSSSIRTRQTFEHAVAAFGHDGPARFEDGLYNATGGELRALLRHVEPSVQHLMIVGHNPGIADAAVMLAREGEAAAITRLRNRFPPCTLAVLVFDEAEWRAASAHGGRLDLLILPEDLSG